MNMQAFKVFQIRLTDAEIDLINEEGHDAVHKNSLRLSMNFGKNDIPNKINFFVLKPHDDGTRFRK